MPSSAFPPYPDPYDQISRVSGKCEMYLTGLHGHGTSACPGASGAPTECTARTNSPDDSIAASAAEPIRVMIRIEVTTYGESVISTPSWEIAPPSGPMQNGTTYMTRPRMHPSKTSPNVARISLRRDPVVRRPGVFLPLRSR